MSLSPTKTLLKQEKLSKKSRKSCFRSAPGDSKPTSLSAKRTISFAEQQDQGVTWGNKKEIWRQVIFTYILWEECKKTWGLVTRHDSQCMFVLYTREMSIMMPFLSKLRFSVILFKIPLMWGKFTIEHDHRGISTDMTERHYIGPRPNQTVFYFVFSRLSKKWRNFYLKYFLSQAKNHRIWSRRGKFPRTLTGEKKAKYFKVMSPTHPTTMSDTRCQRLKFLIYRQQ